MLGTFLYNLFYTKFFGVGFMIPCNTYKIFMSDLICCLVCLCIHTANMTKVTKYHLIPMKQKINIFWSKVPEEAHRVKSFSCVC